MLPSSPSSDLDRLRERVRRLEGTNARLRAVLPFEVGEIDTHLPGGGLALGALHEVGGAGMGERDAAAPALFAAGIAARTKGKVLWCVTHQDLFAPALAQAGLAAARVIHVEAAEEKLLLACFEDGLRHGGLGAVVGELSNLTMTASRRLQLAAEGSGVLALALRRRRWTARGGDDFGQPTAAVTRWRVSVLPSFPLAVPGLGRARWRLELLRCRGAEAAQFDVEASDGQGRLAFSAPLADRSLAPQVAGRRAAG